VDAGGNVYVADTCNNTIRKITPNGIVTTLAGLAGNQGSADGSGSAASFYNPYGVAVDAGGNVYVADGNNNTIRKITPAGVVSTLAGSPGNYGSEDGTGSAARFNLPEGVAVDTSDNVYVADMFNSTIRKITPAGVVSTLAGFAGPGGWGSADGKGSAAQFYGPQGVAVDSGGNLYVSDAVNCSIRKVTSSGVVTTFAGTLDSHGNEDGTTGARFSAPTGIAVDANGDAWIADTNNNTIRKILSGGVVSTIAGNESVNGSPSAGSFGLPYGMAVDAGGNAYVADCIDDVIQKITPSGTATIFAGSFGNPGSADGIGSAARFYQPRGVAVDASGNVYVADTLNSTIRKITPSGVVTTLAGSAGNYGSADGTGSAARFIDPIGVAADTSGNVYVADTYNATIRKITPTGAVTTLAGWPGSYGSSDGIGGSAQFSYPTGLAVDSSGTIYVADPGNGTIRMVTSAGVVTTLAGSTGISGSADGAGASALFGDPYGIAVDGGGTLYITDARNDQVRRGVAMPQPKITSALTAAAVGGQPFGYQIAATNYPTTYNATGLPVGLTVNSSTGYISGTPAASGTFSVVVSATYPGGTGSATLTLTVAIAPPRITNEFLPYATQGQSYSFQIAAGLNPTSYAATGLPPGLSIDPSTGLISGVPTKSGTYAVTLSAANSAGTATVTLAWTVLNSSNYGSYAYSTLAGQNSVGGADGAASTARFNFPGGVAVDASGDVYVADTGNNTIRKITPAGVVSTIAGVAGNFNWGSTDGIGSAAKFSQPKGAVVDASGNVYIADSGNSTIRKITPAGVVSTLAGSPGNSGSADGLGSGAQFNQPGGVAVDASGNVYVADTFNDTIRKITPAGVVTTLAGSAGNQGSADGSGSAASFHWPEGVAVDGTGNVYVADSFNSEIRKITPAGVVTTFAKATAYNSLVLNEPIGIAIDASGNVYVANVGDSTVRKITPAGVVLPLAGKPYNSGGADGTGITARFNCPQGVAVDSNGNVYVADSDNSTIREITPSGVVSTLAGLMNSNACVDGKGSAARFYDPTGVAVDAGGNIYVADTSNDSIRKITPAGLVGTFAGSPGNSGKADGVGSAALFNSPNGVAVDENGNVYVADTGNNTIRRITPAGVVSTLAGIAGSTGSADGYGSVAMFNQPRGVAIDKSGNVYVADSSNSTIRKITPAGVVSTLAGSPGTSGSADGIGSAANFSYPHGVAVDASGDVYVADTNNRAVRKVTPSGVVSTLAGDGTQGIYGATGVAVDAIGNVYVADSSTSAIWKITPDGVASIIGGAIDNRGNADGTGSAAQFNLPSGVAVDASGNVYVADTTNNEIRLGVLQFTGTPPAITSAVAATAGVDVPFSYQIMAENGPTSYDATGLPDGLTINPATGIITGTPTAAGNSTVTLWASNAAGEGTDILALAVVGAPEITSSLSTSAAAGQWFSYQIAATNSPSSYTAKGLPAGLTVNSTTGAITGVPTAAGTSTVALSATNADATAKAALTIEISDSAPVITSQPQSQVINAGSSVVFTVAVTGAVNPGYQWSFNGQAISGATAASYTIGSVTEANAGLYTVTVTSGISSVTSNGAVLAVQASGSPTISSQPQSQTMAAGSTVVFAVTASGAANYQWYSNGAAVAGATNSMLMIQNSSGANAGSYNCMVSNSSGSALSSSATLAITTTSSPGRLFGLSVNTAVGSGNQQLTLGFVTGGAGTSGSQSLLIRANGPSLASLLPAGVVPIPDPSLTLCNSGLVPICSNTGWACTQANEAAVTAADAITGDYPLTDPTSKDSAVVVTLTPAPFGYTINIGSVSGAGGTTVAQVYDNTPASAYTTATPRLISLSCKVQLVAQGMLTAGFAIEGDTSKTVLIRASGPALGPYMPVGYKLMPDPQLNVFNASNQSVAANSGWAGSPQISAAAQAVSAFAYTNPSSADSAVLLCLSPGNYSAQASSVSGTSGYVLVEVYEVP
jgi:sugar lactone lactonase YvrE